MNLEKMKQKIANKSIVVGIIGLGYVGLPLAIEFAKSGLHVIGFDIDETKVNSLNCGKSHILDVSTKDVSDMYKAGNFKATTDFKLLESVDAISICVPTPLTKSQEPDMSYIIESTNQIRNYMKKGVLITLESTTYPGTTEELLQTPLEDDGYFAGKDYFLCYSPERVDPGNPYYNTKNTPKIIGGATSNCVEVGSLLYGQVINKMHAVTSTKTAEMTKLLENTFRSINIAFINEMALLCDSLGMNIWEVIAAAETKPFGYMKFSPGPGIGGHCIPLDPMYLSWKAKESNFYSRFIDLAQELNNKMPDAVVAKTSEALNQQFKSLRGSKIILLGVAYKQDIDDVRESPALDIYELLKSSGVEVSYYDPHVKRFINQSGETVYSEKEMDTSLYDATLLITNHQEIDTLRAFNDSHLFIDTRNALDKVKDDKLFRIGEGSLPINKECVFV
ncbi:nucleotide sugar dehydrogenase [Listeria booriae]|uniref:Nucleotide sugar dehydrogenase n=1 Tax=Listeria booriae TaxID=1552123 RepID=A0A842AYT4_9LIST|nr:nucleotide sugar dehydrogenase [Listeria booriae]MBC1796866.1 nucleotide sugar dehydrogenase [Listeria booriae]